MSSITNFFLKLALSFNRKRNIKTFKPILVFWYISFDGDQRKILKALEDGWGINNEENIKRVLEGVNLDDFSTFLEKDFNKFSTDGLRIVVRKIDTADEFFRDIEKGEDYIRNNKLDDIFKDQIF